MTAMVNDVLADAAVAKVRDWLSRPRPRRSASATQLANLLQDEDGLQFTIDFIDRVVRAEDDRAAAKEFARLGRRAPKFLAPHLKAAVRAGGIAAPRLPGVVVPTARRALREMVSHLVIDASEQRLGRHLAKLRASGAQLNVNLLGEAVLGRREADLRLAGTEQLLRRDDVDYVSIKVSSVMPQLNLWAFEETVTDVVERLTPLYRIAAARKKFINLDMEEYRDLDLTLEVFTRLLSQPEFHELHAGIVLQAYLPDALGALERLTDFSRQRVASGGAGIKIRVVKGANLAMERVDAAVHGWPLATCPSKASSDANYKRVLTHALTDTSETGVRIGVAGHNLFDLAYTIELARRHDTLDRLDVEMLLGMADEHLDAVREDLPRVVIYTPVVQPKDFNAAVAYLVRRLEENGSGENFMSNMFSLDSAPVFAVEERRFRHSLELLADEDRPTRNRTQDRGADEGRPHPEEFHNEPDTDPALEPNRRWAAGITARVKDSRLGVDVVEAHREQDVDRLVDETVAAGAAWAERGARERRHILYACADELARRRGELIEVMGAETGKTLAEGDVEVSEAIDFCRYYADQSLELERTPGATAVPVGLTLVVPPWNFPTAIPCGGTVAALATGSPVIMKPAPQAERTAACVVEALWAGGVPKEVLRFAPIGEGDAAHRLVTHEAIGRLIFTGSSETAARFRQWRPDLVLVGETSGKNGIIVTPAADYDLAANDLARSAFLHAGQKCSAASLGILVGSVGSSERFLRQLVDAVETLCVGYPDDPTSQVGPVIEEASGKLERALTTLGEGERWLLQPKRLDDTGRLWSPGVRVGVEPGSDTHLTEFFGPHLSLIRVDTLEEAIEVQNGTEYGLTAGIHSLDADEVRQWLGAVDAGNLYIGRGITGAIVRRQPFGGWKLSQVGPGAKAGGPNYLSTLVDWVADEHDSDASFLRAAQDSDLRVWESEFAAARDVSALGVERNVLRYRPTREVLVRVTDGARQVEVQRVLSAVIRTGSHIRLSTAIPLEDSVAKLGCVAEYALEDDAEFHARLARPGSLDERNEQDRVRRIRVVGPDPEVRRLVAEDVRVAVYDQPVTASGRLEMLPFLREQAVSLTAHRYGNADPRFVELRL